MEMLSPSSGGRKLQNNGKEQVYSRYSSPGVAGMARRKERRRNVGDPAWSLSSKSKEGYKAKAEVRSDAMQEVGEIVVVKMGRTTKPCRSEGSSVSSCFQSRERCHDSGR